jgi:hypothetical protein
VRAVKAYIPFESDHADDRVDIRVMEDMMKVMLFAQLFGLGHSSSLKPEISWATP